MRSRVSIPGSTVGIFLEGEDSRRDHGLGRLVDFRFKAPPGTTSSCITTYTSSGQRNCASRASQPPAMPRRKNHEVHKGHVVALDQKKRKYHILEHSQLPFVPQCQRSPQRTWKKMFLCRACSIVVLSSKCLLSDRGADCCVVWKFCMLFCCSESCVGRFE